MKALIKQCQTLVVVLCLSGFGGVQAAVDLEAGKALYGSCQACHGANGEGNPALQAPSLAGQFDWYLQRQLTFFKTGVRGADANDQLGAQMRASVALLPDEQAVANVAAYLASLSFAAVTNRINGDLRNGNNYYQSKCGACHGGNAEGNTMINAPRLNGQDGNYLLRQYANFQKGIRGVHPDDRYGKQMKMMSDSLPTEKDLNDVLAFVHSLPLVKEGKAGGH